MRNTPCAPSDGPHHFGAKSRYRCLTSRQVIHRGRRSGKPAAASRSGPRPARPAGRRPGSPPRSPSAAGTPAPPVHACSLGWSAARLLKLASDKIACMLQTHAHYLQHAGQAKTASSQPMGPQVCRHDVGRVLRLCTDSKPTPWPHRQQHHVDYAREAVEAHAWGLYAACMSSLAPQEVALNTMPVTPRPQRSARALPCPI